MKLNHKYRQVYNKINWKSVKLTGLLIFDMARSFVEPVGAYRLGYLVIVKRRYRRPWPTTLKDGTVLKRGDKLVRLHMKLFLPRFRGNLNELSYSRYLVGLLTPELPKLANLLRYDPNWADCVALTGQSHIVGRFTEEAGFETQPIPDAWRLMVDILGRGAMLLADPSWRCLLKVGRPNGVRKPRECWASHAAFLAIYPEQTTRHEVERLRRLLKYF